MNRARRKEDSVGKVNRHHINPVVLRLRSGVPRQRYPAPTTKARLKSFFDVNFSFDATLCEEHRLRPFLAAFNQATKPARELQADDDDRTGQ
jgi:hypothetical protein